MREVIADTSPIQYLHQVGLLNLLPELYGQITIPEAVARELRQGRNQGIDLPNVEKRSWFRVEGTMQHPAIRSFKGLGQGEREVLSLGFFKPDALVLLDDARARNCASSLEISYTGTLGILLRARARGVLAAVSPIIDDLDKLGFRLDLKTRNAILKLAGE